jgi:hypothetical protein
MNELHVFLLRVCPGPRGVLGAVQWPIYILCTLDESTALQLGYTLDESTALQVGYTLDESTALQIGYTLDESTVFK